MQNVNLNQHNDVYEQKRQQSMQNIQNIPPILYSLNEYHYPPPIAQHPLYYPVQGQRTSGGAEPEYMYPPHAMGQQVISPLLPPPSSLTNSHIVPSVQGQGVAGQHINHTGGSGPHPPGPPVQPGPPGPPGPLSSGPHAPPPLYAPGAPPLSHHYQMAAMPIQIPPSMHQSPHIYMPQQVSSQSASAQFAQYPGPGGLGPGGNPQTPGSSNPVAGPGGYYVQPRTQYYYSQPQYQGMTYSNNMMLPVHPFRPRKKSKHSTIWTSSEDRLLRELKEVQKLGWREMSSYFKDRTPNACQFRWRRLVSGVTQTSPKLKEFGVNEEDILVASQLQGDSSDKLNGDRESTGSDSVNYLNGIKLETADIKKEDDPTIPTSPNSPTSNKSPTPSSITSSSLSSPQKPRKALTEEEKHNQSINFLLN